MLYLIRKWAKLLKYLADNDSISLSITRIGFVITVFTYPSKKGRFFRVTASKINNQTNFNDLDKKAFEKFLAKKAEDKYDFYIVSRHSEDLNTLVTKDSVKDNHSLKLNYYLNLEDALAQQQAKDKFVYGVNNKKIKLLFKAKPKSKNFWKRLK